LPSRRSLRDKDQAGSLTGRVPGVASAIWSSSAIRGVVAYLMPEGRHYSCRISGGCFVVLVDEAAEPVATVDLASR
jgi:hypothetical protein